MSGFLVTKPGMYSIIQDGGRYGMRRFGLTPSGPIDEHAFYWANRLLKNKSNAPLVEIHYGGLELQANANTQICITGAKVPFAINHEACDCWRTYRVQPGNQIKIGFPSNGCRSYFAVSGGFIVKPQFGSTATVTREGIGGLKGTNLQKNDFIACSDTSTQHDLLLPHDLQPQYQKQLKLRVILGYQYRHFTRTAKREFFNNEYQITQQCDRMGFRLKGNAISSQLQTLYSEGITLGAIQIPPDGQPIILMQDHQTIGGYPKIGNVLSLDLSKLSQCIPKSQIRFSFISIHAARRALLEELAHREKLQLINC